MNFFVNLINSLLFRYVLFNLIIFALGKIFLNFVKISKLLPVNLYIDCQSSPTASKEAFVCF